MDEENEKYVTGDLDNLIDRLTSDINISLEEKLKLLEAIKREQEILDKGLEREKLKFERDKQDFQNHFELEKLKLEREKLESDDKKNKGEKVGKIVTAVVTGGCALAGTIISTVVYGKLAAASLTCEYIDNGVVPSSTKTFMNRIK